MEELEITKLSKETRDSIKMILGQKESSIEEAKKDLAHKELSLNERNYEFLNPKHNEER